MKMSDECVILDDGKVIEQGNPKEVARHLQKIYHPWTVSATDSSARREISDRTDLFDGRSKRTDQKKRISVN